MALIERVKKQLAGGPIGVAAGNIAKRVADNFLKTHTALGCIDMAADVRERLKSGLGLMCPDLHALAVPAKQTLVRTKNDALGGNQRLPHVGKVPILRRDIVEERDKVQCAGAVRREVSEVFADTHPDFAALVHCKRTHDTRGNEDLSPGNAIVLEDCAAGIAEVHHATVVLQDRPDLGAAVVFLCRIVFEDGQATAEGIARRSKELLPRHLTR